MQNMFDKIKSLLYLFHLVTLYKSQETLDAACFTCRGTHETQNNYNCGGCDYRLY